jgi:DNA-binding Lrp family transcriptional regulator
MAVKAYILIETHVGKTKEVVEAIGELAGGISVDAVTGPYDAIATIEGKTLNDIGDLVTSKFHSINGISRTVTCIAVGSS